MDRPVLLFSSTYVGYDFLRQVPETAVEWNRFEFTLDPTHPNLYGCVVYDDLPETLRLPCPRSHCLLVTGEPPSLRTYRSRYTHQFGAIRTSHASIAHPNKVVGHEGQPWYYGLWTGGIHEKVIRFEEIADMPPPAKANRISVIASNKTTTPDHRERLRFVEMLKDAFGDQIDVFGRGIRTMQDKSEAIYPYEYHVVLENDHSEYYVSEKLVDSYLGWSYPIYSGSRHADELFPRESFLRIDMYQPTESIRLIREALEGDVARTRFAALKEARERVLHQHNLFAMVQRHFALLGDWKAQSRGCVLYPKRQATKQILRSIYEKARKPLSPPPKRGEGEELRIEN